MSSAIEPDVREVAGVLVEAGDGAVDGVIREGLGGVEGAGLGLEGVDLWLLD